MIVTCQKCNSNFKLDDNLVKPTGSTVRCSTCRNVFVIYKENTQITEEDDFPLPKTPQFEEMDSGNDFSAGDLDLSDIQVDFDDDINVKDDLEIDDDIEEDIDLEGLEFDLPEIDEEDDDELEEISDLDLSDIQIDFDDEPVSRKDDEFDLPDLDDLDLPDLDDDLGIEKSSVDEDLTDFDLDEIAGDVDDSKLEDDLDFDLSLDDDLLNPDLDLDDNKSDNNGFLEATDYDPDDRSDGWNVDMAGEKEEKPKKRGCLFILLSMIIVASLAAGGIYYAVKQKFLDVDKIVLPDFVNKIFALDDKGKAKLIIAPYNSSNLRLIRNKNVGVISVIDGTLKNGYDDTRKNIKVLVKFHVKDKDPLSKIVYCGNIIADIDLANMTREEIEARLMMKDGDEGKYKDGVRAGDTIPFMIVFFDLPEDVKGFSIEPVSSNL